MYDLLKVTMLGLFFGTFGTTLGGIIGVRFQNPSNKILSFILSLRRTNDLYIKFGFDSGSFKNCIYN